MSDSWRHVPQRRGRGRSRTLGAALVGLLAAGCAVSGRGPGSAGPEQAPPGAADFETALVLVSLDGFRWDYLELVETPNLRRLAARGVRAEGLIPVFPSKTFPCHYTIVTGLYPERHGIISNDMFDPELGAEFHLGDRESIGDPRWWRGEPIWATAERQGVRSAAMFWPGSDVEIGGVRPSYWHPFDTDFPYEDRVQQVLSWLDLPPRERPRMITLYFEDPNDTSHASGPEAPETFAAVREVDARIGDLVAGLEERGIADRVNLVVVSDHGMAEVSDGRVVFLDDYAELERGEVFQEGALVQIFPRQGRERELYAALHGAHPRLAIYRPGEIPERYHLGDSPRLPPLLGVPDVGWEAFTRESWRRLRVSLKGDHGQDPGATAMHGLFVATGPAFESGLIVERFESVEIYNLLAAALGLEPAPNDGDPARLAHVLR